MGSSYNPGAQQPATPNYTGYGSGNVLGSSSFNNLPLPSYGTEELKGSMQTAPALSPMPQVDNSRLSALEKLVAGFYHMSSGEEKAQQAYDDQIASRNLGIAAQRAIPKPMGLIRGASQNILENSQIVEQTLQQKLALAQAKRQSALDASTFALTREDKKLEREQEQQKPIGVGDSLIRLNPATGQYEQVYKAPSKPIELGDGATLIDPTTGKVIYQNERDGSYSLGFDPVSGSPYVLNSRTGQLNGSGGLGGNGSSGGSYGLSFSTGSTGMRTDRHNNPTAFTTDVARLAGLKEGVDYVAGDPFGNGQYRTAKLLGDPIATTMKVIDSIGFYTQSGQPRWSYINQIPEAKNWANLNYDQKRQVIAQMYQHEGGNGSLLGSTASNLGTDLVGQLAQQVTQNPNLLNNLPDAQKKAVIARLAQTGTQVPQGPASDVQHQAATYATRLQQSGGILDGLQNSIASYNPIGFAAQTKLPSYLQSSTIQQYQQAAANFINAVLRRESGAAIAQSEFDNAYSQYLPKPGDSAATLANKKQNRDTILQGLIQSSGSAYGSGQQAPAGYSAYDPLGIR
jgi:hypothetical protein